jgi:endonuclease YncB( thermonuclease family)
MKKILVGLFLVIAFVAANADQPVIVWAERLNVRAAPSTEAPIVGQVSRGDRLVVTPISISWAKIVLGAEIDGYVSKRYLRLSNQQNAIENHNPEFLHDAVTDNRNETDYSPFSLLFFLVLMIFFTKAFSFRSEKKESAGRGTEPEIKSDPVAHHRSTIDANATNVRKDLHDASQTKSLDIGQLPKTIHDFPLMKVEHVIDGDTVMVASTWKTTKIRLDSIDCPEDGQPWGNIATAGLIKMIGGRWVRIEEHGEDHYGRLLATIYVEDLNESEWINVNEKMVAKGHAWVMRKYYDHLPRRRKDNLNRLERWARTRKVGLWRTRNPVPPWRWRRGQ